MIVHALATEGDQVVQHRNLGVFGIREGQDAFGLFFSCGSLTLASATASFTVADSVTEPRTHLSICFLYAESFPTSGIFAPPLAQNELGIARKTHIFGAARRLNISATTPNCESVTAPCRSVIDERLRETTNYKLVI
jgi:hypothetical protein